MKKLLLFFSMVALTITGCQKYDDGKLWNSVNGLEDRVSKLERLCGEMNTNISALQTIVNALQTNDYVTGVTPIMQGGNEVGYTITFTKSSPITIYHGKDGKNGTDGKDGQNGQDGITPVIGVRQDADGIYYWTLNGEWLHDAAGNKIKAQGIDGKNGTDGKDGAAGTDGKDGQNGSDGITPQLKIENDYWYISYDNGNTWLQLGRATGATGATGDKGDKGDQGNKGDKGEQGDSMFSDIDYSNADCVVFTLSNGTQIKLPTWSAFETLRTMCNQMNTNISALQTMVNALQNNDYVTGVTPIMQDGREIGYTIKFSKSNAVTIYHGKDGKNGTDGKDGQNGQDGKDGSTPIIGVKQDTDDIYYWTLNGEWLQDAAGNKIKAQGIDGKNGTDGKDGAAGSDGKDGANGITPQLKIDGGYWYISYDNGTSWTKLGQATGDKGDKGDQGDSIFESVAQDDYAVYFKLSNGTIITIPKAGTSIIDRIKSITYMPRYSDGNALMAKTDGVDNGVAEFDFKVSPSNLATELSDNYNAILSMKAIYTQTRIVNYINLPITGCKADADNGIITVTVSGENLNDDFFDGNMPASASLFITDNGIDLLSGYVCMIPRKSAKLPDFALSCKIKILDSNVGKDIDVATSSMAGGSNKVAYIDYGDGTNGVNYNHSYGKAGIYDVKLYFNNPITEIGRVSGNTIHINIPKEVINIGTSAFSYTLLESIEFEAGSQLIKIGENAFGYSKLQSINIPASIQDVGYAAFGGCADLCQITCLGSVYYHLNINDVCMLVKKNYFQPTCNSGISIIGKCRVFASIWGL